MSKLLLRTGLAAIVLFVFVFLSSASTKSRLAFPENTGNTYSSKIEGDWKARIEDGKIKFQLEYEHRNSNGHSNISLEVDKNDISDLRYDKEITFQLKRECGTMFFTGKFSGSKGKGEFEFSINENFVKYLEDKGFYDIKEENYIIFFTCDINKDFINGLSKLGYNKLTSSQLTSFAIFRVTPDFIKDIQSAGYSDISAQKLVDFRIFKVTPEYIKEISRTGVKNIKPQNLIDFKIFNVTGKFIDKVKNITKKKELTAGYIVNAKIVGVKLADNDDNEDDEDN